MEDDVKAILTAHNKALASTVEACRELAKVIEDLQAEVDALKKQQQWGDRIGDRE